MTVINRVIGKIQVILRGKVVRFGARSKSKLINNFQMNGLLTNNQTY